jgi:hypothetical protein
MPASRRTLAWAAAFCVIALGGVSLTGTEVSAQTKKPAAGKKWKGKGKGTKAAADEAKDEPAEDKGKDEAKEKAEKESKVSGPDAKKSGGSGGAPQVVETKTTGDAGVKTYKFGPVEVEGRLKSPQVVYFMRRVRAEFAAGMLGHRSFMRELSDTRRNAAIK